MNEYWQRLQLRIDALTLRERAMAFGIAALLLITLISTLVIDPLVARKKQLSEQVKADQQQITAMQAEIQIRVKANEIDPDAPNRLKLQALKQQSVKLRDDFAGVQKGLVSPDKMASLLEDLLKQNGRLHLTSLKTLPATLLNEPVAAEQKNTTEQKNTAGQAAVKSDGKPVGEAVYKHGVELVVQGSYADILSYLSQLESMPWQLFWAKAKFQVDAYPKASLTLTLFTLSLDKTWLNI